MFLHMIYSILSCLSLHYSQNKPKEKAPPQKTKWASIPHEAYFIAKRTKFRCSSKSIYSKAQLARTKCKLGYISLSSQIVKKLLRHF